MPPPKNWDRQGWQCAQLLYAWLRTRFWQRAANVSHLLDELNHHHRHMLSTQRRLQHCRQCELLHTQSRELARLQRCTVDLHYNINSIQGVLYGLINARPPDQLSIYRELQQLADEFGSYSFDPRDQTLCVTTPPVTLEHVPLGPFTICLEIPQLADLSGPPGGMPGAGAGVSGGAGVYRIIAEDPNPAAENPSVTHPHVNQEKLCTGDAVDAVHHALEQGRIADFFLIVRGILETYNDQSPYVKLEDWQAQPCADCGEATGDDDAYVCETCLDRYCPRCIHCCGNCGMPFCSGCLQPCSRCNESFCASCLEEDLCPRCLTADSDEQTQQAGDQQEPDKTTNPEEPHHATATITPACTGYTEPAQSAASRPDGSPAAVSAATEAAE